LGSCRQVLGADISSSSSTSFELRPADKAVLKASSLETHFLKVEARQSSASEVISRQNFEMTGTLSGIMLQSNYV